VGGERIFYYGGGGQGNHLPGGHATGIRRLLGMQYRSNALAQEKTGEFWVNGMMFGGHVKGDFEHCEVAIFLGKNPWYSHGLPRARAWLRNFSKDPARKLVVIDPVVTETAGRSGVAVNELTSLNDRDRFAGTPHHKIVPARVEAVA
jgi:anaerobic selenocysteine-containing dehydrogenase